MHLFQHSVSMWGSRGLSLVGLMLGSVTCGAQSFEACGSLHGAFYGPYDYRKAPLEQRLLVENYHFDAGVETLTRPIWSFGGDITYTLRAFPNHPRALLAMVRLGLREKTEKPRRALYTVECFFIRAVRFTPDDGMVRALYGYYLAKKGDKPGAIQQLEKAQELAGGDANIHYTVGLTYLDLGEYDRSLGEAKLAYDLGYPLSGLKDRLKAQGKWRD